MQYNKKRLSLCVVCLRPHLNIPTAQLFATLPKIFLFYTNLAFQLFHEQFLAPFARFHNGAAMMFVHWLHIDVAVFLYYLLDLIGSRTLNRDSALAGRHLLATRLA